MCGSTLTFTHLQNCSIVKLIERLVLQPQLYIRGGSLRLVLTRIRYVAHDVFAKGIGLVPNVVVFLLIVYLDLNVPGVTAVFRRARTGGALGWLIEPDLGVPARAGPFWYRRRLRRI